MEKRSDRMDLMMRFDFALPTRIEYGPKCGSEPGRYLDELGVTRVLVVTDAGIRQAGLLDPVEESLSREERTWSVFDAVSPNPRDEEVERASEAARAFGADGLLAVGGGSVLDCAKAASILIVQGGKTREYEDRDRIGVDVLPMVAVPTTAGSGSEVTFGAVITDASNHDKFSVKSPRIAPRIALVDPEMTLSMPPGLTAATGMDALTHAIEGYTATSANVISDAAALRAVSLIVRHLVQAVHHGDDLEARAGMLLGSVLAGIAFSHSDVGAVHCLAESMGGLYDAPHGACNAVVLPEMMQHNRSACPERYAEIAAAMGLSFADTNRGAKEAVAYVRRLAKKVRLPGIRELGLHDEDFEDLARRSVRNGSNGSNPRPMAEEDYLQVLRRLAGEERD